MRAKETELYFSCPICAKTTLKSKGQMQVWTRICKECYQKILEILDAEKKVKEDNNGN